MASSDFHGHCSCHCPSKGQQTLTINNLARLGAINFIGSSSLQKELVRALSYQNVCDWHLLAFSRALGVEISMITWHYFDRLIGPLILGQLPQITKCSIDLDKTKSTLLEDIYQLKSHCNYPNIYQSTLAFQMWLFGFVLM